MALQTVYKSILAAVERDLVPDFLLRRGIRYLLSQRVRQVLQGPSPSTSRLLHALCSACMQPTALDVAPLTGSAARVSN